MYTHELIVSPEIYGLATNIFHIKYINSTGTIFHVKFVYEWYVCKFIYLYSVYKYSWHNRMFHTMLNKEIFKLNSTLYVIWYITLLLQFLFAAIVLRSSLFLYFRFAGFFFCSFVFVAPKNLYTQLNDIISNPKKLDMDVGFSFSFGNAFRYVHLAIQCRFVDTFRDRETKSIWT